MTSLMLALPAESQQRRQTIFRLLKAVVHLGLLDTRSRLWQEVVCIEQLLCLM